MSTPMRFPENLQPGVLGDKSKTLYNGRFAWDGPLLLAQGKIEMYAVVRTGGKQYRVTQGQTLLVELLPGQPGDRIELTDVLMLGEGDDVTVGQPLVEGAKVGAQITGQHRSRKVEVFRYKAKKRVRVRRGHRQRQTRLHIQSIEGP